MLFEIAPLTSRGREAAGDRSGPAAGGRGRNWRPTAAVQASGPSRASLRRPRTAPQGIGIVQFAPGNGPSLGWKPRASMAPPAPIVRLVSLESPANGAATR